MTGYVRTGTTVGLPRCSDGLHAHCDHRWFAETGGVAPFPAFTEQDGARVGWFLGHATNRPPEHHLAAAPYVVHAHAIDNGIREGVDEQQIVEILVGHVECIENLLDRRRVYLDADDHDYLEQTVG